MDVNDGATGEVYLDIEVVGAMAPKSIIDVYFAPWAGDGYLNSIDQAIHNDDYAAISISYGIDEDMQGDSENPAWPLLNQNVDAAFREAAASDCRCSSRRATRDRAASVGLWARTRSPRFRRRRI